MSNPPPDWLATTLRSPYQRFYARLAGIRWLVLDVDGVLTTGNITYSDTGLELKTFNAKDGQGLALLPALGVRTALLTARQSALVDRRAQELGITAVCQAAKPKLPALQALLSHHNAALSEVAYMGDDWPDCPVLEQVGFATCPADAIPAVIQRSDWVSPYAGGQGAVRSLCDLLLAINGFNPC
jgi:3-deoxy-D-manno-octulosonate 8-phosphate phosphatase (KDO 8-P phosphatase)